MIPFQKVKNIIEKHNSLEKELSSGNIEPKLFAKKSKEYSNLKNIIEVAKEYLSLREWFFDWSNLFDMEYKENYN